MDATIMISSGLILSILLSISLILSAVCFGTVESTTDSCKDGWVGFGDYCYIENTVAQDYATARSWCIEQDSNLTSIHSQEEQDFHRGLGTAPFNWIGLDDIAVEGTLKWLDGTPVDFRNFGSGEPNNGNGNGEDCVTMSNDGSWQDISCRIYGNAICKQRSPSCGDYYDEATLEILKASTDICQTEDTRSGTYDPSSNETTIILRHDNSFFTIIRHIYKISIDVGLINSTDVNSHAGASEYSVSFLDYSTISPDDKALQIGDPISFNVSIFITPNGQSRQIALSEGNVYAGTTFWLSKDGDTFSLPIHPPIEIGAGVIHVRVTIIDSGFRWPSGIGSNSAHGSHLNLLVCSRDLRCESVPESWAPLNTPEYAKLNCPFPASDDIYRVYQYACTGATVIDIDECAKNTDDCNADATCINTVSSYTCRCNDGYDGDGITCFAPLLVTASDPMVTDVYDVDECADSIDDCHVDATCINSIGSYTCQCNDGYDGDGRSCLDFDECANNTDNCHANATCINTVGNYTCQCNDGYVGDGRTCLDIDECATNTDDCHANAMCINTVGSYTCSCNAGYDGDGITCLDIDECAKNTDDCHADATCINTVGNYTCQCNDGYDGDGRTCFDIDECATNTDDCHANAICINTVGSYTCRCNAGYDGDGITCLDIDDCAKNTDDCHVDATCINTVGNYTCQCNDGYNGDGRTCLDVDECLIFDCNADATCKNTVGSYTCRCNEGYDGDGRICSDVDECETNVDGCHADATCTNTVGDYICECKAGYEGSGSTCAVNEDLDSIAKIPVTENNVVDIVANLTQVINEGTGIDSQGLESIAIILDGVADVQLPAENLTRSVVAIVDDVLTNYDEDLNEDSSTPQDDEDVSPIPNQIQRALESQISSLQSDPDGSNNTVIEGENVVIHAVKIARESLITNNLVFESIPPGGVNTANGTSTTRVQTGNAPDIRAEAAISLPSDVFLFATGNSSAAVPVSFFVYKNTKLFPSQRLINDSDNPNQIRVAVASRIITANVEGVDDIINLPENSQVETTFALVLEKDENSRIDRPQCVFWDVNANDGVGDWSNKGCQINRTLEDGNVVCQCNHLTSFAVLVDIYGQQALVLDFISKIGCSISITCLLIMLVTYLSNRKLREKTPQQIMINFCFSLLCLYLVFVIGIDQTTPRWGCTTVSVLIHYFTLTSISWMGVEATNMYILFVKVVGVHISKFMLKSALAAWGLPAVIVIIALSVDHEQYVNQQHCFLEIGNTFYFAQLLIMGLVITYNTVIFVLVMHRLLFGRAASSSSHNDMKSQIIKRVQNAVSITALLGLTWVFGLLSLIHEQSSLPFLVLFCLFNSMQGFLVFVMFCVRQKNVVKVWKGWFSFGKDSRSSRRGDATWTTSAASSTLDRPAKKQPRAKLADKGRNDINMDQFQCTYVPPTITKSDDDVLVDNNKHDERKVLTTFTK